jgi:quercetin 2,3-dioxygenase
MTTHRRTGRVIRAVPASDGAGVRLFRSLGSPALPDLDPFLMLDHFRSDDPHDYIAGFPSHPHRGFETVTYMLDGRMLHRDSEGNTGDLGPGSVQWMTAGRGIIHSEMPQQVEGRMRGFQLWVNLPRAQKRVPPRYQDIPGDRVPTLEAPGGAVVRVLAGRVHGVEGPVQGVATRPLMLDVDLPEGGRFEAPVPEGHTAFAYVFEGRVAVGEGEHGVDHLLELVEGDTLALTGGEGGGRALVLAGAPIHEPVVKYGPFVMNSVGEVKQAILDYQQGRLTG